MLDNRSGLLGSMLGVMLTTDEIEKSFRRMDPDGDGEVTFDEFEL